MKKDNIVGQVFETNDLGKFKLLSYNRKTSSRKNLKESIKFVGLLQPISVTTDFEVVDGQNRLIIMKELNKPIRYIFVNKENNDKQVRAMNSTSKNWTPVNYLDSFCSQDKKHYQEFKGMVKYLGVSINVLYKILRSKELLGKDLEVFKNGEFTLSEVERQRFTKVAPILKDLLLIDKNSRAVFSRTKIVNGAVELFFHPKYNHNKLKNIIMKNTLDFYNECRDKSTSTTFKILLAKKLKIDLNA